MCGRFVRTAGKSDLAAAFGVADASSVPDLPPSYNLPPTRPTYVVGYNPGENRRGLTVMSWGLVPRWWKKGLKDALRPFNAKAEEILEKPTFRDSFLKRRCIVPVAGFFEWKKVTERVKEPYFIHPDRDAVFAFAGVWDSWTPPDGGERLLSFATLTTEPNEFMAQVHNRMPTILPREAWDEWLNPATPIDRIKAIAVARFPVEEMVGYPVGPVRGDGPELLRPAAVQHSLF